MKKLFCLNVTGIDKKILNSPEFNETENMDGHELLVAVASEATMDASINCALELKKEVDRVRYHAIRYRCCS